METGSAALSWLTSIAKLGNFPLSDATNSLPGDDEPDRFKATGIRREAMRLSPPILESGRPDSVDGREDGE